MSDPLTAWMTRYIRDPAEVERALVDPVLLYEPPETEDTDDSLADHRFKTVSGVGAPAIGGGEPVVIAVKKQKDNAFQRGITVGRTSNNDLVIDDPSVSRFHAWFQHDDRSGEWSVADAGSKNGTSISGERLKAKKLVVLVKDTRLRFGSIEVTFLMPKNFLRVLKARTAGMKR
jgi:hypothetical protein